MFKLLLTEAGAGWKVGRGHTVESCEYYTEGAPLKSSEKEKERMAWPV